LTSCTMPVHLLSLLAIHADTRLTRLSAMQCNFPLFSSILFSKLLTLCLFKVDCYQSAQTSLPQFDCFFLLKTVPSSILTIAESTPPTMFHTFLATLGYSIWVNGLESCFIGHERLPVHKCLRSSLTHSTRLSTRVSYTEHLITQG
jgi:hypothetical protein